MAREHTRPPFDELTTYTDGRRLRGEKGGETVVDSRAAVLVWEPGKRVPVYAVPRTDVSFDDESALTTYDDPDLEGYVTVAWKALDRWLEEDEEVVVHPRDPFHRVDALRSSRHVRAEIDGTVIAESERPVVLFETGLPPRYYLPREDVDEKLLEPSPMHTGCPYKGVASYFHVVLDGARHTNLLWYYPEPLAAVAEIRGLLAPYNERVDLIVDGEREERPETPWSAKQRAPRAAA